MYSEHISTIYMVRELYGSVDSQRFCCECSLGNEFLPQSKTIDRGRIRGSLLINATNLRVREILTSTLTMAIISHLCTDTNAGDFTYDIII